MRDFITVEDVNTINYSNQSFYWHEIDMDNITESNEDFTNVKYDFCKISRETTSSLIIYTVDVLASHWTNCYEWNFANSTSSVRYTYSGGVKYGFPLSTTNVKLYLYMGNVKQTTSSDTIVPHPILDNSDRILTLKEINENQDIEVGNWYNTSKTTLNRKLNKGLNSIYYSTATTGYFCGFLNVILKKTDFQFLCNQVLTVGKINKVYLGTDSDYLPNGDLVGTYTPTITVTYNGETLPVMYDETDYYFNLDLTDKTETGKVRFTVNVEANEVLNSTTTEVALNSQYQTVNTFNAFLTAIASNDVIRLGANLTATSTIPVNRSVKIIGNDKTLDLDGYQFNLHDGVEFKAENLQLNNGDTTIIQAPNTKVELTSVTFTNCTSSDYNNLGSCIFCDSEAENINIDDDFNTVLTDCQFINNHNAILHGGQLDINRCKFHNTDPTYVDIYNPAFIYQTDGECTILNSVFDIDYGTDYSLCTGEQSIGFSQCIFMCGTTATINAITYDELKGNNLNGFFDNPQNNRSHIYAKYYYPQIETCVFSSPTSGNEDKALCYGLGGDDMIHKINCQVTRADSGNENDTRRISW